VTFPSSEIEDLQDIIPHFFVSASNEIQHINDDSMNYVKDLSISLVGINCFKSIQPMYGRHYRLVLSC